MNDASKFTAIALSVILFWSGQLVAQADQAPGSNESTKSTAPSAVPHDSPSEQPESIEYRQLQKRLAQGWNTWDVNSVTTYVLLPAGLAIHVGLEHNATSWGNHFLPDALIGRLTPGSEQVIPGPHTWDGSYTEARLSWKGHTWELQSAHAGKDLVLLARPLTSTSFLPPTIVFSVNYLWNLPGIVRRDAGHFLAQGPSTAISVYCTCKDDRSGVPHRNLPITGPYFAVDFREPVGISTGGRRTLAEIEAIIDRQQKLYRGSITAAGESGSILDAIETTIGWDTIFDPEDRRVISPVSRVWCVQWGGWVLFDWDTFFAATMAGIADKDVAYANTIEILREETPQGFVPNYARAGGWKSFDRSEPPVGAITVLGLYKRFHDRWFLEDTFKPLLRWNRWWVRHRDIQGYLTWGSDGENLPRDPGDRSIGTRLGAILESGLDNSPMYDDAVYDPETHILEFADVGLMSLYIADCDALASIADTLGRGEAASELRDRSSRYRAKLATLWNDDAGIYLNKDLHTGKFSTHLSPTNFYPLLAHVATPEQARIMIERHLLNPDEFWGQWVIPSVARNDPAFHDQDYWRGRIWGPMNYLIYLGLRNYDDGEARRQFAQKSFDLFLKEWKEQGHVHENYNAISGSGDDVPNSDRFYHWGALLGYVEYLEQGEGKN